MPTLGLSFLGPPRVDLEGRPVEVASRKAVALLAYLAITGRPHSREHLAALFWPEADTEHARGALRAALAALRRAIGDTWIAAEGDTLSLWSGGREQGAGGQGSGDRSRPIARGHDQPGCGTLPRRARGRPRAYPRS